MKCRERRAAARTFDFDPPMALDAGAQQSTIVDSIPMGRANAVRVSIMVMVLPAGAVLAATLLGTNDDENRTQLAVTNINQPGIYSFLMTGIAFAMVCLGFQAFGPPNTSAVYTLSIKIANS